METQFGPIWRRGKATGKRVARDSDKPRVLLTNAYGPYPSEWGQAPSDLLGARLARGHAMFQQSSRLPTWALYLIAENISNPATVLEFPTWQEFTSELERGYDYVAIQLMSLHTKRVVEMMKYIREHYPQTQIIIGGYGVGALKEGMPGDRAGLGAYVRENADHLCRREGVRFMRELLGDRPFDRPVAQQEMPTATVNPFSMNAVQLDLPAISVSLGCPAACNFCNTSAFFRHKKIRIATPAQVYATMKSHQERLGRDRITFILFDEDLFLDPEYVRELGRLIRSDERTWGFRWITFGSMGALSKFTAHELRYCGVEGVWIGVESGLAEEQGEQAAFAKRQSDVKAKDLFAALRGHGIMTIGSMILGLDFHTKDNIERDIDYFVNLRPTFYQVGPIRPCPGTKLYRQMLKEGRIRDTYDWQDFHLWKEGSHDVPNFQDGELRRYYDLAHEKLARVNGNPVLQIFEANLLAYVNLLHDESPFMRYQSKTSLLSLRELYPVVRGIELSAESGLVRLRATRLLENANRYLLNDSLMRRIYRVIAGRVVGLRLRSAKEKDAADFDKPVTGRKRYADMPAPILNQVPKPTVRALPVLQSPQDTECAASATPSDSPVSHVA